MTLTGHRPTCKRCSTCWTMSTSSEPPTQLQGCVSQYLKPCEDDKPFVKKKNTFVGKSICTDPCRPLSPPSSTCSHSGICSQQPLKLLGLVLPETRQASHQWQDHRTTMSTCSTESATATTSSTFSRLNSPYSYLSIHLTTCWNIEFQAVFCLSDPSVWPGLQQLVGGELVHLEGHEQHVGELCQDGRSHTTRLVMATQVPQPTFWK